MQRAWVTSGAVAAMIGGAAWTVKALAILVFLYQPPFVFEFGPPLFVIGTWALWRAAWTPTALMVYAAVLLGIVTAVYAAVGIMHLVDETPDLLSLAATLTLLLSLALVGIGVRRRRTLPPPWHHLPFWMGLLMVPLLALFGGIGVALGPAAEERLIEVPILLFGLAWMTVGYRLFPMADAVDETSGA